MAGTVVAAEEQQAEPAVTPRGSQRPWGVGAVIVAACIFPWIVSPQWQSIGVFALIAAIAVLGLHVLTGLAGQLSLGHSAFVGIGAYTAIYFGNELGMPLLVWLLAATLIAALVGATVAPFVARLRGLYLAVVTVAVLYISLYVWGSWEGLTGGSSGRPAQDTEVFGHDFLYDLTLGAWVITSDQLFYFLCLIVLMVGTVAAYNLKRSRPGIAFGAIRDRDLTAAIVGVPVARMKMLVFSVAAGYGGLAGALMASYQSYVVPEQWNLMLSVQYLAMLTIGGIGSLGGAIAGAVFVTAIPQIVTMLAGLVPFISTTPSVGGGLTVDLLANLLYGLSIVLVLVFEPRGLAGIWERLTQRWARRRS